MDKSYLCGYYIICSIENFLHALSQFFKIPKAGIFFFEIGITPYLVLLNSRALTLTAEVTC